MNPLLNKYFNRAITLAQQAGKAVKSNPQVGCVIVHNDRIIGEGYHQQYGGPHAEVNAIASVTNKSLLAESTIYVTLEPCNHQGKTPPCCDLILKHRIPNVVVGCVDPTPLVNGTGIQRLIDNGVNVNVVNHQGCQELVTRFIINQTQARPYTIIKYAQTKDGYIGNPEKEIHLSGGDTDILVHKWRSEVDGIMVGNRTALVDNPTLNTRHYPGDDPTRIVFDYHEILDKSSNLLSGDIPTIVLSKNLKPDHGHVTYLVAEEPDNLQSILQAIYEKGINTLLIEGGAYTINQFLEASLWDEARVITCPVSLGSGVKAPQIVGKMVKEVSLIDDRVTYIRNPALKIF